MRLLPSVAEECVLYDRVDDVTSAVIVVTSLGER